MPPNDRSESASSWRQALIRQPPSKDSAGSRSARAASCSRRRASRAAAQRLHLRPAQRALAMLWSTVMAGVSKKLHFVGQLDRLLRIKAQQLRQPVERWSLSWVCAAMSRWLSFCNSTLARSVSMPVPTPFLLQIRRQVEQRFGQVDAAIAPPSRPPRRADRRDTARPRAAQISSRTVCSAARRSPSRIARRLPAAPQRQIEHRHRETGAGLEHFERADVLRKTGKRLPNSASTLIAVHPLGTDSPDLRQQRRAADLAVLSLWARFRFAICTCGFCFSASCTASCSVSRSGAVPGREPLVRWPAEKSPGARCSIA